VSFGDPDGETSRSPSGAADGSFSLSGFPGIGESLSLTSGTTRWWTPFNARQLSGGATVNMGQIAMNQWQSEYLHQVVY